MSRVGGTCCLSKKLASAKRLAVLRLLNTLQVSQRTDLHFPSLHLDQSVPNSSTGADGAHRSCPGLPTAMSWRPDSPGALQTPPHSAPLLLTTRKSGASSLALLGLEHREAAPEPTEQPCVGRKNPVVLQRESIAHLWQPPAVCQAWEDQREIRPKPGLRAGSQERWDTGAVGAVCRTDGKEGRWAPERLVSHCVTEPWDQNSESQGGFRGSAPPLAHKFRAAWSGHSKCWMDSSELEGGGEEMPHMAPE